jgi:hypothetical protein
MGSHTFSLNSINAITAAQSMDDSPIAMPKRRKKKTGAKKLELLEFTFQFSISFFAILLTLLMLPFHFH